MSTAAKNGISAGARMGYVYKCPGMYTDKYSMLLQVYRGHKFSFEPDTLIFLRYCPLY